MIKATDRETERLRERERTNVLLGCALHETHHEQIVIDGKVGDLVDGRDLVLMGCNLVVACLERNSKTIGLFLERLHEFEHLRWHPAKVMIAELLILWCGRPKQTPAADDEIPVEINVLDGSKMSEDVIIIIIVIVVVVIVIIVVVFCLMLTFS